MYSFRNDYSEGAHPKVLQALTDTNALQTCGYGLDDYSLRAADVIREKCGQPGAAVHIMAGGTSANSIAIAAFLRPYEAAICAPTGHINVHETGAVEATGHKVLPCAAKDGKVTPEGVEAVCALHTDEHMVAPRLLYISQPTEIGTVYHLDELKAHYQRGGLGDVKVKKFLNNVLQETLEPIRTRRKELEKDPGYVMDVLRQGTEVAQAAAAETLAKVKHAMKIDYFA